jgi:hypothetical protein
MMSSVSTNQIADFKTLHSHLLSWKHENNWVIKYRVSIKSFPDYRHLLQETYMEYKLFLSKCNSTQDVFLETNLSNGKKKYVCIPHSFLVINVCNQRKILCSPCITIFLYSWNLLDPCQHFICTLPSHFTPWVTKRKFPLWYMVQSQGWNLF